MSSVKHEQKKEYTMKENEYGEDYMLRNIGYLFGDLGDFNCNEDMNFFELWNNRQERIKRRIDAINLCLDAYDILFPYEISKPVLNMNDLEQVHKLMDSILFRTSYRVMSEVGTDLTMEIGSPGWIELKKVLLRFFSKITIDREFEKFEEEVEGTGHVRPLYRDKGINIKGKFFINIPKKEN